MTTAITPTPGRVIWFQPSPDLGLGPVDEANPLAGMIAFVNAGGTININFLDRNGNQHAATGVPLIDPTDDSTWPEGMVVGEGLSGGYFAYWMPYQLAAAAKAESTATLDGVGAGGAKDPK